MKSIFKHTAKTNRKLENFTKYITSNILRRVISLIYVLHGLRHYAPNYASFSANLLRLWNRSGVTFLVQYLKVCTRIVHCKITDTEFVLAKGEPRVRQTDQGYPAIIPEPLQDLISLDTREGKRVIQSVLSILSLYRVIRIRPKLKLGTITDPFNGTAESIPLVHLKSSLKRLLGRRVKVVQLELGDFSWPSTAGPNGKMSRVSIPRDAFALLVNPTTFLSWWRFTHCLSKGNTLRKIWWRCLAISLTWGQLVPGIRKTLIIGVLHKKEEAAGKVRVFAVADWFSQQALRPVHKYLFKVLSRIPIDGTIDQNSQVERLRELVRGQTTKIHSFDLSAATDRLPIKVQADLLSLIIGEHAARLWKRLLTDRDWYFEGKPLKYAVGQPIGAYSSWGMLALTHHVIVQLASAYAGNQGRYERYAVLGDDIVILDENVASHYLRIITDLGVEINLSKSLINNKGYFEFAKRFCSSNHDLTGLGPKAMVLGVSHSSGVLTAVEDAVQKNAIDSERPEIIPEGLQQCKISSKTQVNRLCYGLFGPGGVLNRNFSPTALWKLEWVKDLASTPVRTVNKQDVIEITVKLVREQLLKLEGLVADQRPEVLSDLWAKGCSEWKDIRIIVSWMIRKFHPAYLAYERKVLQQKTDIKAFGPVSSQIRAVIDRYDLMRLKGYVPSEQEIMEVWDLDPVSHMIDWTTPPTSELALTKKIAAMQESMVKSMIRKDQEQSGMVRLAELLRKNYGIGEGAEGYSQRILAEEG